MAHHYQESIWCLQAEQYNGQVLLAHENDDFQVIEEWEPVNTANVQTPLDVYKCLNGRSLVSRGRFSEASLQPSIACGSSLTMMQPSVTL